MKSLTVGFDLCNSSHHRLGPGLRARMLTQVREKADALMLRGPQALALVSVDTLTLPWSYPELSQCL